MTIYNDDGSWHSLVVDAEVAKVFERYGILDERIKRKVVRNARERLAARATRDVSRLMIARALGAGWRPPSPALEPLADMPTPASLSTQERLIRWGSLRPEFSLRDAQRALGFETALDARVCLSGLVARGDIEVLAPPRRAGGGRLPSPHYRVVRPKVDDAQSFERTTHDR